MPSFHAHIQTSLNNTLKIPSKEQYGIDSKMTLDESINIVLHHQNLLGWKSGFISKKSTKAFKCFYRPSKNKGILSKLGNKNYVHNSQHA